MKLPTTTKYTEVNMKNKILSLVPLLVSSIGAGESIMQKDSWFKTHLFESQEKAPFSFINAGQGSENLLAKWPRNPRACRYRCKPAPCRLIGLFMPRVTAPALMPARLRIWSSPPTPIPLAAAFGSLCRAKKMS